ncbi:MAG: hypothetical protein LUF85_12520 [Bacteroides sp.]|nr:hypothetical protein [Bacteroides sp.]
MKHIHWAAICFVFLWGVFLTACDDEKSSPIRLADQEDTTLNLWYPYEKDTYTYSLVGGDGTYTAFSYAPDVVGARIVSGEIELSIQGLGYTEVVIRDNSGNSLSLDVHVDHYTQRMLVDRCQVYITGDPEESEREEIEKAALSTLPVEEGGGYKFVFTDKESTKGSVYVYPVKFGEDAVEGTFVTRQLQEGGSGTEYGSYFYDLTIGGKKRTFALTTWDFRGTRTSEILPVVLLEDVTEQLITDYPEAETVYTLQRLELLTF